MTAWLDGIDLVSFDLDGTLYSARALRRAFLWRNLGRLRWVKAARAAREGLRGRAFADGAALTAAEHAAVAARLGIDAAHVAAPVHEALHTRVCHALTKTGPRADARATLHALVARGVQVAVVSDYAAADKLAALGLADVPWAATLGADATGALKPDPRVFHVLCAETGVSPARVLHVGDRADTDVAGAQAAGMRTALLGGDLASLGALLG